MQIDLFTAMMRREFLASIEAIAKPLPIELFTTIIPSTARIENYAWMTPTPGISRYVGHRRYGEVDQIKYTVVNEEFDGSLTVLNRDVEDDQIGGYKVRMRDLAEKARVFPQRLVPQVASLGSSTPCFDGSNFFATTHNLGTYNTATYSGWTSTSGNSLAYTSNNSADGVTNRIIFFVHNGSLKPMIYQNRKAPALGTNSGTPQALEAKRTNYWVDLEGQAAFGYWWDAILVTITNSPSLADIFVILDGIVRQFRSFGLPVGLPTDPVEYVHEQLVFTAEVCTVLCSTGIERLMWHALYEDRVGAAVVPSNAGITWNIYRGLANLLTTNYLNS